MKSIEDNSALKMIMQVLNISHFNVFNVIQQKNQNDLLIFQNIKTITQQFIKKNIKTTTLKHNTTPAVEYNV